MGSANKPFNSSPLPPGSWSPAGGDGLVLRNASTGQWAVYVGRGNYDLSDAPPSNVPTIVANQGFIGQLREALTNGWGAAVALPFGGAAFGAAVAGEEVAGAGLGTSADIAGVDASTGLFAGESASAGSATYGTLGGAATGASSALPTWLTSAGQKLFTSLGTSVAVNALAGKKKLQRRRPHPRPAFIGGHSACRLSLATTQ